MKCPKCGKVYKSERWYKKHVEKCAFYKCEFCNKEYQSRSGLAKHKKKCTKNPSFQDQQKKEKKEEKKDKKGKKNKKKKKEKKEKKEKEVGKDEKMDQEGCDGVGNCDSWEAAEAILKMEAEKQKLFLAIIESMMK